ncbi:NAD(P)-dependent oxidoreductase [bacterium M00.F.Ca.ET.228.01.1.1]|uniref:NAD(P)-dependent oxidoreductase n=2 Tax=Pseudomonadota TaxID=1224 RepID=UPI0010920A09|nr:NAD(P)-dependent oxidoreductase [Paraburkholderia phenoliruptrix]TGP42462.1 NAD(P)-dependent oxidoreductase [bacterium M00.F.Ca.ET.228.01.1.1]TGS00113.1 NAD(P)-dependent oxidoreductase [bacterium M00.F.Ca.ET.191.01.1.1]TGU04433.1 NAD(P)-dependent oxidoreductase [bacterium M00.F.Ca.ET.155.01.1.1]MBW0449940.1 NAD(P)-dependent oxidoreductase [Paraburkholderia phenoliruptrix]MBW9098692.1 NAD(P)-dependent oxidoreductase [Paraburkholderia phenoliruptrix]
MSSSHAASQQGGQPVGFVGVGTMGRPMARRLVAAGHNLVVYDRDDAALAQLEAVGARATGSVREVADSARIVFTSLPTPAIFRQVAVGAGGLIEGEAIRIMVDLSTVGSRMEKEVADALLARGIETVDAPVSGGAAGATKGTLAIMAAGNPAALEEVRSLFEVLGKVFVVGDKAGQGQLLKLLNNMLSSTAFAITSEAFVAGVRGGLDPEVMMSVINAGSGKNGATLDKFPKHVLPRTFDFGFPVASVCKDIGLAVDECQALGVPMWIGSIARQVWNYAAMQDGTARDMTELVKYVERWSSVDGLPD